MFKSVVFVAWSILALVLYPIYFALNPLPAYDSDNAALSLDTSAASWVASVLMSFIVLSLLVLLKTVLLLISTYTVWSSLAYVDLHILIIPLSVSLL